MKSLGHLNLLGNMLKNVTLEHVADFPTEPVVGSFIFKDKRLMICVELNGSLPVWIPMTQEMDTYEHVQSSAESAWSIPHNLNTSTALIQCFDTENNVIIPDKIDMSAVDNAVIEFSVPVAGRAIVMMGRLDGMPKPAVAYEGGYAASTEWVVNHGLGYNPIIRCYVGSQEVQPYSIVHDSTTKATITFSEPTAGRVICL